MLTLPTRKRFEGKDGRPELKPFHTKGKEALMGDWKELSKETCMQHVFTKLLQGLLLDANKIAYIYLSTWLLHKTDISNFFANVIMLFFQYTT